MGWLIGISGDFSQDKLQDIKSLHSPPLHTFQSDKIYLAAGGIPETCLGSISEDKGSGWMICGLGILYENDSARFMNKNDWDNELSNYNFNHHKLNGHFAAVRWNKDKVELFTDQLGIRNLYLTRINGFVVFSTRPDWILKINNNISIDWKEFSSRWLLFNQINAKSFLNNVDILTQAGSSEINLNPLTIKVSNRLWHPDLISSKNNSKDFISVLKDFTVIEKNKKISLALSGGIDSRILLSFLVSSELKNWAVHTFYLPDHPDTKIAKEITSKLNIEHVSFEPEQVKADKIIPYLVECIGETNLASPVSKFLSLQFYSELHNNNKIIIDGGFGELARRRFLNRVALKGKNAIYNKEADKLLPLLTYNRAHIFKRELYRIMEKGMQEQMENALHEMASSKNFGLENWLDLFSIRTRVVQFSVEQARSDRMVVNYMPFIQPYFLKKIFEVPVKKRKSSRLFYQIINNSSKLLSEIPLVKGDMTYPFGMGTFTSSIYIKFKSMIGFSFKDNLLQNFLLSLEEYVQDTINSQEFLSCEYYDHKKIKNLVNEFYINKTYSLGNEIDWWLTFDIWRKNFLTR